MSQCLGSSLENDIRLHASGSEKVVFAQRNPLAEMYPNAVFRNFEQEKVDECLEVSRQRSQPAAHIVFCIRTNRFYSVSLIKLTINKG